MTKSVTADSSWTRTEHGTDDRSADFPVDFPVRSNVKNTENIRISRRRKTSQGCCGLGKSALQENLRCAHPREIVKHSVSPASRGGDNLGDYDKHFGSTGCRRDGT